MDKEWGDPNEARNIVKIIYANKDKKPVTVFRTRKKENEPLPPLR